MTPPYLPLFKQKNANDPIVLGEITADLTTADGMSKKLTAGQAELRFLPDPRCEFKFPTPNEEWSYFEILTEMMTGNSTWRLEIGTGNASADCEAIPSSLEDHGLVLLPTISPISIVNKNSPPVRCVCHLLNWPPFSSRSGYVLKTEGDGVFSSRSLGQIIFELNDWKILVTESDNAKDLFKSLI